MRRPAALLLTLVLSAGCSAPPEKELDLAQGAIDAARAAGAPEYATQEFSQATAALQQARDAVDQRDYRLALTRALDAHDRAQIAAKGAADGKARARSEADLAIAAASSGFETLRVRITAAQANKVPKRDLATATKRAAAAEAVLQKARATASAGDYAAAKEMIRGIPAEMKDAIAAIEAAAAKKPARPARRVR